MASLRTSNTFAASATASAAGGVVEMMHQVAKLQQSCSERGLHPTVRISLLELRGRRFSDLLSQTPLDPPSISIRDSDTSKHPSIVGAEEVACVSASEMLDCLKQGISRLSALACGSPSGAASNSGADEAGNPCFLARADSREQPLLAPPCRHPDSHLVLTFSILLQGMRGAMPSACSTGQGKPPQPPPAPRSSLASSSAPGTGVRTPRMEAAASSGAPPQEECMARATIRIIDLSMPPSISAQCETPSGGPHTPTSREPGCEEQTTATSPPQPIPAGAPAHQATSGSGSLESAASLSATAANASSAHSPRSPPAVVDSTHHVSLQTSSRRLRPMLPTPSKVASIASGGEPRADVMHAAQVAGLIPSPQSGVAYSNDGLSGFEALERALDSTTHGSPVMRYK